MARSATTSKSALCSQRPALSLPPHHLLRFYVPLHVFYVAIIEMPNISGDISLSINNRPLTRDIGHALTEPLGSRKTERHNIRDKSTIGEDDDRSEEYSRYIQNARHRKCFASLLFPLVHSYSPLFHTQLLRATFTIQLTCPTSDSPGQFMIVWTSDLNTYTNTRADVSKRHGHNIFDNVEQFRSRWRIWFMVL